MHDGLSPRVWAGDRRSVAKARARFVRDDPQEQLIPYATTLYSFRYDRRCANELISHYHELYARAERETMRPYGPDNAREVANRADTLSTHLEWMSRQASFPRERRQGAQMMAEMLCTYGAQCVARHHYQFQGHHTPYLLKLTAARIDLGKGNLGNASRILEEVIRDDPTRISDPNQRVRVYRKLGLLLRKRGARDRWGIRALLVPEVPLANRLKSAAALLDIDR
jgi:hypothetical protein